MHMKCPVCGNQLESGYVSAAQVVFLQRKSQRILGGLHLGKVTLH